MQDKKETSKKYTLKECTLDPAFKDVAFPTRVRGMNTVFEVLVDDVFICHLLMDTVHNLCIPHLNIPVENRTRNNITDLVQVFWSEVHPWCNKNGFSIMVASCDGDDVKTTELFKTFGFSMHNVNLGIMQVQKDEGED